MIHSGSDRCDSNIDTCRNTEQQFPTDLKSIGIPFDFPENGIGKSLFSVFFDSTRTAVHPIIHSFVIRQGLTYQKI